MNEEVIQALKDALVYQKKRKQEFLGHIPSMQVDGSLYCGGNVTLESIQERIDVYSELVNQCDS